MHAKHVPEVDAVEVVPLVVGLLVERLARAAVVPDVVDEHVDAPELVARRGDERVARRSGSRTSHTTPTHRSADRDLRLARPVGVDLGEHDRRAFGDEPFDDAAPDPAAAARDDRDLAREQRIDAQRYAACDPRELSLRGRGDSRRSGGHRAQVSAMLEHLAHVAHRVERATLAHALGHVVEVGLVVDRDAPRR